jgi:hypothetical protein
MQVITANALANGRVVFQTAAGWSTDISAAQTFEGKDAEAAALARANLDASQNRVVEPYAVDVTMGPAGLVPTKLRERIRAEGPTTGHSKDNDPPVREQAA